MGVFSLVRELWKYSEWNCQRYPWTVSPDSLIPAQMLSMRHSHTCRERSSIFEWQTRHACQKLSLGAPGLGNFLMLELWNRISSYHLPVVQLPTCTFLPNNSQSLEPRALPQDLPSLYWFSGPLYSDPKMEAPRDIRLMLGNITVGVRKITCHNYHTVYAQSTSAEWVRRTPENPLVEKQPMDPWPGCVTLSGGGSYTLRMWCK